MLFFSIQLTIVKLRGNALIILFLRYFLIVSSIAPMAFKNLRLTEKEGLKVSPKILIVDDSESDRFSFVRYLQSDKEHSYQIIEVETLEEGLEQWRSQQPDVVLLDINLPDGDGLEFLEEIGTDQAINKLPVIMLTGQGDERIAVRAMKLGAADYLVKKDITALLLLTAIRQVQENDLLFQQLRRSQQQQTIIASMALHICRSLNFEEVANQIVQEIRRFLEADRTIIYRFNPDMSGVIVAEAITPPWLPCLNAQVEDTCFQENLGGEYQQGKIFAAADIYAANLTECHIELLERFQVRANLVVPILLNGNNTLWGLLIAHQCSAPRQWHEEDIQLLHQLSVHLAIALQQAELYQNLETTNNLLEEKVRERTKKIQLQSQVLEEIHDGVVTTDSNGMILSWNRGSEKLYGYTEAEVLGRNIGFMYEDAENLQSEVLVPVFKTGKHTAEVIVISKSGKRIYVSLHLSVVKDEQGNITHLIGCANDITERKRAEQELQQLNQELETKVLERTEALQNVSERLGLALKSGAFGCWEWNLVQNTKIWDKRMYKLYELPQQADGSITYEDWANRLHPEDRTSVETLLQQAILGEAEYDTEFRVLHPDESIHFIKAYGMVVRDGQGHPQTMIGINFDISDRKRIEAALIESEAKFRRLVEGANDLIWSTDANWCFNYLSPQFQILFGFDSNDWIGKSVYDLVHPEDRDLMTNEYVQAIQSTQKFSRTEFRHLHQDGHYLWVSINTTLITNAEGIVIGAQGLVTDISDRKQTEAALIESEAKFRRLVEGANDLIWSTDTNGIFDYLSPQFQTLFGFDPNDWIGKPFIDLVHPEDHDWIVSEYVRTVPSGEKVKKAEFRHLHQDGHYVWVSVNTTPIINADSIIIGNQGILTDISERKKAEQELLENQRLIQQIADCSPNVLYLYDLQEQRNIYINREILATLGYSAIEVQEIGAAWLPTVIHPDDLLPTLEHFERLKLADDNEIFSHEYRLRHANGQWRYFYSRDLVFSRDTQGQVKLIIGTAQDITDRKLAEAALRASEQRWQFALESAGDGVWDWNIQENQLFFSRQWKAMLGYADEEIENRFESWENLVHPDDLSQCHEDINKCLNQETLFYENEHQLRCKDGSYKWILARGKVIEWSADGHALRMMGTHTDLSDRKLAEAQLQQKNIELQQLVQLREEALTLREDMSNMIVHDLRNPLSAMLLSAEIIQKYGDRPDKKTILIKKAEQILTSGNRLKAMIDSLLLMAKLESGKILFNPVPTDLHELGTAIVSDFELTAQSQRIELKGELPNPGNSIIIDAVILRRVIENLISNALKFSPPNSQVRLQIEYLPENHLRVKVTDNGPGVSPDQAEDIFKKFEIGTVKQNVSQIGLGLAFCKMAVEAQGGTLAIAPNQPQGSIFTLEI